MWPINLTSFWKTTCQMEQKNLHLLRLTLREACKDIWYRTMLGLRGVEEGGRGWLWKGKWGEASPYFPQWVLEKSRCCPSRIDCHLYLTRSSRGGWWEVRWAQMGNTLTQSTHMLYPINVYVSERLIWLKYEEMILNINISSAKLPKMITTKLIQTDLMQLALKETGKHT